MHLLRRTGSYILDIERNVKICWILLLRQLHQIAVSRLHQSISEWEIVKISVSAKKRGRRLYIVNITTTTTSIITIIIIMVIGQGGRSCAGARGAPAEKFGLRRKFAITRKNDAFDAKIVITRLTKIVVPIFTPHERLPSSATLLTTLLNKVLHTLPRNKLCGLETLPRYLINLLEQHTMISFFQQNGRT